MKLPAERHIAYWESLGRQIIDPRLACHQAEELRVALRDCLHELKVEKAAVACLEAGNQTVEPLKWVRQC